MDETLDLTNTSELSDVDLVRCLLLDEGEPSETQKERVREELDSRGVDVDRFVSRARVQMNDDAPQELDVEPALARLQVDREDWDAQIFTNAVEDRMAIQKTPGFWVAHLFDADGYQGVQVVTDPGDLVPDLTRLLRLDYPVGEFTMDGWEILASSLWVRYVRALGHELAEEEIPYVVHTPALRSLDPSFARATPTQTVQIYVPEEDYPAAKGVLDARDKEVDALFAEADRHADAGEPEKELAVYDRIQDLAPDNGVMHFNRGAILFDLKRTEEAADAFLDAVPLMLADDNLREYLDEVRSNLEKLLSTSSRPNAIRHSLTSIARFRGNLTRAEGLFEEILSADPADSAAHLNLAQLYYEDGTQDEKARSHFRRYLELEPGAPDREAIEGILEEL